MGIPRVRRNLTWTLLIGQLAVIVAGSVTLAAAALAIGPSIFHRHVRDALGFVPPEAMQHLEDAFGQALWLSLAVGITAATLTAATVSWIVSTRIVRPVGDLAAAARDVSRGNYSGRVAVGGTDELSTLARSFNEMSASLGSAEERRRRLLSDVAHELRTPLATLDAYLEGLFDGVVDAGPDTWALLRSETSRLGRIAEDVTKVSRAEERQLDLRLQRVAASSLLKHVADAAAPAFAAKDVTLQIEADNGSPDVDVDVDRLGEVLANLLENALRHTPSGGTVTLAAHRDRDVALLTVADTGVGLAREDLDRVFERFYRIDSGRSRERGGSGVGLAIARALVEAHGGRLWAESAGHGQGARFICRLSAAR